MHPGVATVERSMELTPQINYELPYDLAIPLLEIHLRKPKTVI